MIRKRTRSLLGLRTWTLALALSLSTPFLSANGQTENGDTNAYAQIDQLFVAHCLDCHSHDDPDAGLNLETYETFVRGGQNGSPIIAGESEKSPLIRLLVGFEDPNGKKRIMPPGRRQKLSEAEIQQVRGWIDSGAQSPPEGWRRTVKLEVPRIEPTVPAPNPIHALDYAPSLNQLAVGTYRHVELRDASTNVPTQIISDHLGNVNAVRFSADGATLFSASGEPGLSGEVKQWDTTTGKLLQTFAGHHDSIYSLALNADASLMATGSYDQQIILWDTQTGKAQRTLNGHQGAVFALDFRPDGKVLASASADRTIKLWNVATGKRLDTLSQPLKEQHALCFGHTGEWLYAAGVDNRIRVWNISESATETTNPLIQTVFAHEGTILNLVRSSDGATLASTADDRTIKLWSPSPLTEQHLLEAQPDWSPALAFVDSDRQLAVGRLDGSLSLYQTKDGKPTPKPKPEIVNAYPRGLQAGGVTRVQLEGKHLLPIKSIQFENSEITAAIATTEADKSSFPELLVYSPTTLAAGSYPFRLETPNGTSNAIAMQLDTLTQASEAQTTDSASRLTELPVNVWGTIRKPGETDRYQFPVRAGENLVFDVAADRIGSPADLVITLHDAKGRQLVSSQGFDGSKDPLLVHSFTEAGTYELRVAERFLKASPKHDYRVSIGAFPFVTDVSPRLLTRNRTASVQLIGYNLGSQDHITLLESDGKERTVPLDPKLFRFRKLPKIQQNDFPVAYESEPNDQIREATRVPLNVNTTGRIHSTNAGGGDVDYFVFTAETDQRLVIETIAAQIGSPVDTRIEVLDTAGKPIERLLLEAVRDTAITFRPITSTAGGVRLENWEEMALNDYLYLNGEVVKLFLAPRGPDSSWDFYPANGTRRTYFDTTSTAHPNFDPAYIVRPHPPGTALIANGLPRFPVYYENDDHSEAGKGRDSRVYFQAPHAGDFVARVVDTRNLSSPRFVYQLLVREQKPDFEVTLSDRNPTINRGSGRSFTVNRKRIDGYDGEIQVEFTGIPEGVRISNPITIEAGHHRATGTLFVDESVSELTAQQCLNLEVTASARLGDHTTIRQIANFGRIKVGEPPALRVTFEPDSSSNLSATQTEAEPDLDATIPTIVIEPGTTVPAHLKVVRNGHEERITFSLSNLPHGVIVDNIGLNGVLMPEGVSEREIFITAADWVLPTDRLCHAVTNEAGRQASRPVRLRVVAGSKTITQN